MSLETAPLDIIMYHLPLVELFDIQYYRDLEIWVKRHSRSLNMVPFESLGTVSYSHSITTIAVSSSISEIFSVKNGLILKSRFGVVQDHIRLSIGRPL